MSLEQSDIQLEASAFTIESRQRSHEVRRVIGQHASRSHGRNYLKTDDGRQQPTHDPWRVPSLDEPGQLGRLVIDDVRIDQYRRLEAILRSAARFRKPSQAKSARRPIIDALLAQACVLSQSSPKARDIIPIPRRPTLQPFRDLSSSTTNPA